MSDVEIIVGPGIDLLADPAWNGFVATAGTVFHSSRFLLPWWRDTVVKQPASQLLTAKLADGTEIVGVCAFELRDGFLAFAGGQNVVDYMGPAATNGSEKEVAAAVTQLVFDDIEWSEARFSGLVVSDVMAQALIDAVKRRTPLARVETYDHVPKIAEAPKGYLALLNAKRRSEVLRKRNRLAEAVGETELVTSTELTWPEALERQLAWKANASPAMRDFVIEYGDFVRSMLAELAPADAGHVVELCADNRRLASAIVLSHRRTKYLYNMSYDMALTADARTGLAPGVVLVSHLVEETLDAGWQFDFLKGAQDYKLRLGGIPEEMIAITVQR